MYFPIGWPQVLASSEDTLAVVSSTDKSLVCVLSSNSLSVWFCKPSVQIVSHQRDNHSLQSFGANKNMVWKPDSTIVVVHTDNNYLLFYKLLHTSDANHNNNSEFVLQQREIDGFKRETCQLFIADKIPSFLLILSYYTRIRSGIMCLMAAEEEIVMATKNGEICGVNWDSTLDESFVCKLTTPTLSFNAAINGPLNGDEINVIDIKYSSMIGGFALVFSCGRAAFMPLNTSQLSNPPTPDWTASLPQFNSRLQFVADTDNAVCCAINHKFQLIAYGLRNTSGVLCCLDENEKSIFITHRLTLSSNSYPNANLIAGALICMQWSPDSTVLATSWEKGGFAIWSVFGALIACSLSWDFGQIDSIKSTPFIVNSMAWGKEGYHLWMSTKCNKPKSNAKENGNPLVVSGVCKLMLAKSVVSSNPSSAFNGELVFLNSEERLFIGVGAVGLAQQRHSSLSANDHNLLNGSTEEEAIPSTNVSDGEIHWQHYLNSEPIAVGNLQWIVVNMPQSYLAINWPIRYTAIDNDGQHIAIAGRSGLAHYSLIHRKWKLFGNESQERDFEVCGGLLWFNQYIVLSCYNLIESAFEIRAYSQKHKLDNQFVRVTRVSAEVLLMSIFTCRLLTYQSDASIHLYSLDSCTSSASSTCSLSVIHLSEVQISNLIVPPECVTLVLLTNLHMEEAKHSKHSNDSILMNVCGRLLLLEKEISNNNNNKLIVYKKVSILASGVENVWLSNQTTRSERPHLTQSLYLSCGSNGMGVWLPLFPYEEQKSMSHSFMSKRIMLPISTHIYPLAVLFGDAVVLGAENDLVSNPRQLPIALPFSIISRTSQVYLHHILRELLRRNLGLQAWQIANSCTSLPYFPHSLELLLHEVLEEEAISSHPIPDALLPRVIDFIREFPVFLQTVVHCARKTELALWPHLFSIVGNAKELFKKCLAEGELETAASYIIVLQNLESTSVSKHYAVLLLESARKAGSWQVVKDLQRFLRAIDPSDDNISHHNTVHNTGHNTSAT